MKTRREIEDFESEITDMFYNKLVAQNLLAVESMESYKACRKIKKIVVTKKRLDQIKSDAEKIKKLVTSCSDFIKVYIDTMDQQKTTSLRDNLYSVLNFTEDFVSFAENNCPETELGKFIDKMEKEFSVKK